MKTILLILALTGFTAAGTYAQNKNCGCDHKMAVRHHKVAPKEVLIVPGFTHPVLVQEQGCFMHKAKNIGIDKCMDNTYDSNDGYEYGTAGSYTGNYPKKTITYKTKKITRASMQMPCAAATETTMNLPVKVPAQPCYTYRQHNIVVKECPDVFYDRNGNDYGSYSMPEYSSQSTYTGNYPKTNENQPQQPAQTEKVTPSNPNPDGSLCFWGCR